MNCTEGAPLLSLEASLTGQLAAVAQRADIAPRLALTAPDGEFTYEALHQSIDASARALRSAGVAPGERVAILAEPSGELVATLLGVMRAGATVSPMEQSLSLPELVRRVEAAGIRHLVLDDERHERLRRHDELAGVSMLPLRELAATRATDETLPELSAKDDALALFTSGSTGASKAVLLSHRNLLANALGVIEATPIGAEDRLLNCMPLYHTNSLCNQIVAPLLVGAHIVLKPRFRAAEMEQWLLAHRPTYFTGVPTMFFRLLEHRFSKDSLRTLRFVRCGSAPLSPAVHEQIERHLGVPVIVSYGCTEATCTTTINPPEARRIGSVGKVLRDQEVGVLDASGVVTTEHERSGEVCIRGETLMRALLPGPAPGERDYPIQQGWLRTGDIGHLDAEGYLTLTGKAKNVIVRGGENLSPELIENALLTHRDVAGCCVVGVEDEEYGEVPMAYVVPVSGGDIDALCDEAAALVKERLGGSSVPHFIEPIERLPENAAGKVDRLKLSEMARQLVPGQ